MNRTAYIALAILVNCIWGTAFLIPYLLDHISPLVISLGRYLMYGLVSLAVLLVSRRHWHSLTAGQWATAFALAFAGNLGYYLFLTSSIQISGITVAALIVGILPVSLIVVGNLVERTLPFRSLMPSMVFILAGMITLGWNGFTTGIGGDNMAVGSLFAILSLVSWTFYGVKNARYLKAHPNLGANTWSLAIGVCCLVQSLVVLLGVWLSPIRPSSLGIDSLSDLLWVWAGCAFLGIVVSWVATIWWNQASRHLPVALAGQLIVFETLSSLLYGFLVDQRLPTMMETSAIVLVVVGVLAGLYATRDKGKLGCSVTQ